MSKIIRPAVIRDLNGVCALGIEALNDDPLPNLVIKPEGVRKLAIDCISSASNFCWVCEKDGKIVGAVSAIVYEMAFYERRQCEVVQFYCKEPGEGVKLIREFLKWARSRRIIKLILFTLERGADPRIGKMLRRMGLDSELPMFMEVR